MIKRIFKSISVICALAVIFSVALIAVMLFGTYEDQMADEIRAQAELLQFALAKEEDEIGFFDGFSLENRVSLIAPDGTVLYDSDVHAADMDDHSNRPEIASALETGRGESQRYSQTLSETTTYYALRT